MKNTFYLIVKTLFILKIYKILCCRFGHVRQQLDMKVKVNFKIYDVTNSRSKGNQTKKFDQ